MDVSVIVCAKNAERTLARCLESIRGNGPSEIIVVDDGSIDGTVEIAGRYADQVCYNEGRGLAYARQLGAEKASGSYVSYVDSDVVLTEGCLETMLEEMTERGYVGIHAQIMSADNANYWQWAEDQHFRLRFNKEGERSSIITMAAIYKREAILEYRFDPFFTGAAEDGDLCYRLRGDGLKVGVASAFAYHHHRGNLKSLIRQRMWYGRGNARFFWKHRAALTLFGPSLMVPFGVLACLKRRSPRLLPYYLVWSISATIGVIRELSALALGWVVSKIP